MLAFTVRKYHKWLSLVIGIQALLWLASGVYMVVVNLDFIHGDHLVKNEQVLLPADTHPEVTFTDIQATYPDATSITLKQWIGEPHYQVLGSNSALLVDAVTGQLRSPLSEADAIAVALYHYAGEGRVTDAQLFGPGAVPPSEIQTRPLPLWQINFDDFGNTSFYVSPDLGNLVTRRHTFWRIFDFVWMLHIMDYQDRSDVNNNLFRVAATLGVTMSIFGMWLLYFSFRKTSRDKRSTDRKRVST
ncbi:MAG: hypothetical protein ACI9CB_000537 [Rhodothermales bacterium]|jgi:hypothetical protein